MDIIVRSAAVIMISIFVAIALVSVVGGFGIGTLELCLWVAITLATVIFVNVRDLRRRRRAASIQG
jgi:hypothetical protein